MLKSFRSLLSVFVLAAFAAFWSVGQIPGLHVHEQSAFVFHPDGECRHADRTHSDFGGSAEDSHDDCLICHLAQGFHSLALTPVDAALTPPDFVVSAFTPGFKFHLVSFDHASRAPPLG